MSPSCNYTPNSTPSLNIPYVGMVWDIGTENGHESTSHLIFKNKFNLKLANKNKSQLWNHVIFFSNNNNNYYFYSFLNFCIRLLCLDLATITALWIFSWIKEKARYCTDPLKSYRYPKLQKRLNKISHNII